MLEQRSIRKMKKVSVPFFIKCPFEGSSFFTRKKKEQLVSYPFFRDTYRIPFFGIRVPSKGYLFQHSLPRRGTGYYPIPHTPSGYGIRGTGYYPIPHTPKGYKVRGISYSCEAKIFSCEYFFGIRAPLFFVL